MTASPQVLYSVGTSQPLLAFTIDDGPDPVTTPRLLKLLKQYGAKVTFFPITGRIPGNEAIMRQMVAAGHEIGNHMTKDEKSIDLSPEVFERKLLQAHDVLSAFAEPIWFRPGSGWYDDVMLEIVARHGYRCVLGNVYPVDAQIAWPWMASQVILKLASPGDVIILHDAGGRGRRTIETLSRVLPKLRERGYRFVTLSELVAASKSGGE